MDDRDRDDHKESDEKAAQRKKAEEEHEAIIANDPTYQELRKAH